MIQRIQSLYLILAMACMGLLLFLPFGEIITKSYETVELGIKGFEYQNDGKTEIFNVLPLTIMLSLSVLVTFVSIFLFKKRMIQIRFNVFNLIIQIGSIGLMFFYLFQASSVAGESWSTKIWIIMPLIAMIFTYLAIRAIGKDEALVRSISRMR
ncbi:MAG: DUF4293 domain-containing protein [Marinilabiliales bacterium]|nr:MAG: DUF4293 domain-containing protein [Marinilabiliales bacterium]